MARARVLADEVVAHAFSHGFHPDHTARLAAYWADGVPGGLTIPRWSWDGLVPDSDGE